MSENGVVDLAPPEPSDPSARIRERWPEIEALLESSGRNEKLDAELISYVSDLRTDNAHIGLIRWISVCASGAVLVFIWALIVCILFYHHFAFTFMGENARVALLGGAMLLTGVIIVAVLRGAFRMAKERHEDNLPENLRLIIGAISDGRPPASH